MVENKDEMISKELVKLEIRALIESTALMLKETIRLREIHQKDEFGRGRYEGIIVMCKEMLDNFMRFAIRIGVDWKNG